MKPLAPHGAILPIDPLHNRQYLTEQERQEIQQRDQREVQQQQQANQKYRLTKSTAREQTHLIHAAIRYKHIPQSPNCLDITWVGSIILQHTTQTRHLHIYAALHRRIIPAARLIHQFIAR